MQQKAEAAAPINSFYQAVASGRGIIAEYKRKSPSKGKMNSANIEAAPEAYAKANFIKAISVLTDADYFDGSLEHLGTIKSATKKPILRKDFIYDEYQIYEARAFGADALLLMTQLFVDKKAKMAEFFELATSLGLDVLFEVGLDTGNAEALINLLPEKARLVGVNSRVFKGASLGFKNKITRFFSGKDFSTDRNIHQKLRQLLPTDAIAIAESGIHNSSHLKQAFASGYQVALVGTAFMAGPQTISDAIDDFATVF